MFYINTEECVQFARWLVFRVYAWRRMVKRFTSLRSEALKGLLPQKRHLIIMKFKKLSTQAGRRGQREQYQNLADAIHNARKETELILGWKYKFKVIITIVCKEIVH